MEGGEGDDLCSMRGVDVRYNDVPRFGFISYDSVGQWIVGRG